MANKPKTKDKKSLNQPSVVSFLTKTKRTVHASRKDFLNAKIIESIGSSNEANIQTGCSDIIDVSQKSLNTSRLTTAQSEYRDNAVSSEFLNTTVQSESGNNNVSHESHDTLDSNCSKCNTNSEKLKAAKVLLQKTSQVNLQKDLLIQQLRLNTDEGKVKDDLYKDFEKSFDASDLKKIRSVLPGPSKDSNFVMRIVAALYNGSEYKKLGNRSATGRKHSGIDKPSITPEKKNLIHGMLRERVLSESKNCSENDVKVRLGKINRFLKSAIHNISTGRAKKADHPTNHKSTQPNEILITSQSSPPILQDAGSSLIDGTVNTSQLPQSAYPIVDKTSHQTQMYPNYSNQPSISYPYQYQSFIPNQPQAYIPYPNMPYQQPHPQPQMQPNQYYNMHFPYTPYQ